MSGTLSIAAAAALMTVMDRTSDGRMVDITYQDARGPAFEIDLRPLDEFGPTGPKRERVSRYAPHQGAKECAKRRRRMGGQS